MDKAFIQHLPEAHAIGFVPHDRRELQKRPQLFHILSNKCEKMRAGLSPYLYAPVSGGINFFYALIGRDMRNDSCTTGVFQKKYGPTDGFYFYNFRA